MQIKAFEMRASAKKSCLVSTYFTLLRLALLHFSSAQLHADRALGHGRLHGRSCEPASPDVSEDKIIGDACGQSSSSAFNDCSTQIRNYIQQAGIQSCERSNSTLANCQLQNTGNNANCDDQRLGQDQCLNYTLQAYAYCGCYYSIPSDLHTCANQELKLGTSGSSDRDSGNAARLSGQTTATGAKADTPINYAGIQTSEAASSTVSEARIITVHQSASVINVTSTVSDVEIISYYTSYESITFTVSESNIQTVHLHHGTPTASDGLRTATPGEPGGASGNPSSNPSKTSAPASDDLRTTASGETDGASDSPNGASTPRFHRPTPGAVTGSENRNLDGSTTGARPSLTRSPASFSNATTTQKSVITEYPAPAPAVPQQSDSEQRQGPVLAPGVPPIPALSLTASEQRQAGSGSSSSSNNNNNDNNLQLPPNPTSAAAVITASPGTGIPAPDGLHTGADSDTLLPSSSQAGPQDGLNAGGVSVTSSPLLPAGTDSMMTDSPYMIGATQDRNTGELQSEIPVQTQTPPPPPPPPPAAAAAAPVTAGGAAANCQQQQQQQQQQQPPAQQSSSNAGPLNVNPPNEPDTQHQPSGLHPSNPQAPSNSMAPPAPPAPPDSNNNPPPATAATAAGGGPEATAAPPANAGPAAVVSSAHHPSSSNTIVAAALGTAVIQPAIANGGVQLGVMCPASSCRKRSKIFG